MSRYTGVKCPVCETKFTDNDNVVVCPECGAPYHRDCYDSKGGCIFADKHGTDDGWQRPAEETINGDSFRQCSACGAKNPVGGLFCQVCGNSMITNARQNEQDSIPGGYTPPGQGMPGQGMPGQSSVPNMPPFRPTVGFNPYTTPFGGLDPEEEIDGVPVKEIAMYVGPSSHYFLPLFKGIVKEGRKVSFSWVSFLLGGFYFLYRKVYWLGAILYLMFAAYLIPAFIMQFELLPLMLEYGYIEVPLTSLSPTYYAMSNLQMIMRVLLFGVSILTGVFGNYLYCTESMKKIKHIKSTCKNPNELPERLSKQGGVDKRVTIAAVSLVIASYFAIILVLTSNMLM